MTIQFYPATSEPRFHCDPYRDLLQDVLKVETATYKLLLVYDDVTGEYELTVYFRITGRIGSVTHMTHAAAMARATRFIAEHPAPAPVCFVDY